MKPLCISRLTKNLKPSTVFLEAVGRIVPKPKPCTPAKSNEIPTRANHGKPRNHFAMTDDKNNKIINEALEDITPEDMEKTRMSLDIAVRLHDILDEKGMTQKDLAALMGKKESEVSRWLTGMHNFTMKSIAKLHVALQTEILAVPGKAAGHEDA